MNTIGEAQVQGWLLFLRTDYAAGSKIGVN